METIKNNSLSLDELCEKYNNNFINVSLRKEIENLSMKDDLTKEEVLKINNIKTPILDDELLRFNEMITKYNEYISKLYSDLEPSKENVQLLKSVLDDLEVLEKYDKNYVEPKKKMKYKTIVSKISKIYKIKFKNYQASLSEIVSYENKLHLIIKDCNTVYNCMFSNVFNSYLVSNKDLHLELIDDLKDCNCPKLSQLLDETKENNEFDESYESEIVVDVLELHDSLKLKDRYNDQKLYKKIFSEYENIELSMPYTEIKF